MAAHVQILVTPWRDSEISLYNLVLTSSRTCDEIVPCKHIAVYHEAVSKFNVFINKKKYYTQFAHKVYELDYYRVGPGPVLLVPILSVQPPPPPPPPPPHLPPDFPPPGPPPSGILSPKAVVLLRRGADDATVPVVVGLHARRIIAWSIFSTRGFHTFQGVTVRDARTAVVVAPPTAPLCFVLALIAESRSVRFKAWLEAVFVEGSWAVWVILEFLGDVPVHVAVFATVARAPRYRRHVCP